MKKFTIHHKTYITKTLAEKLGHPASAQEVLEAARPTQSPIHDLFEWDDGKAAEQWRLHQAGEIVVAVRVVQAPPKRVSVKVAAREVRAEEKPAPARPIAQAAAENAMNELRTWAIRYYALKDRPELRDVFSAIEKATKTDKGMKKNEHRNDRSQPALFPLEERPGLAAGPSAASEGRRRPSRRAA